MCDALEAARQQVETGIQALIGIVLGWLISVLIAPVFTHVARHTVANDPRPSVASSSAHLSPTVRRRPLAPR